MGGLAGDMDWVLAKGEVELKPEPRVSSGPRQGGFRGLDGWERIESNSESPRALPTPLAQPSPFH